MSAQPDISELLTELERLDRVGILYCEEGETELAKRAEAKYQRKREEARALNPDALYAWELGR